MSLQDEGAFFGAQAFARVRVRFSFIFPVGDLQTVDPYADMRPGGDDCFAEPLLIVRVDASGV